MLTLTTSGRHRSRERVPRLEERPMSRTTRADGRIRTIDERLARLRAEAGLRCGEIAALEWRDVDLGKRQLCVQRSDWHGHVTTTKGGKLRYVPMTTRLTDALRQVRHLKGPRVFCDGNGGAFTPKMVSDHVRRAARRRSGAPGRSCVAPHVLLAPGDARSTRTSDSGARRSSGTWDDATLYASESGRARCGDSIA